MNRAIIDSVAILTAMLLLIFAAFAFSYKKGKITSHNILSAFLFANSLYIIDFSLKAIENATGLNLQWFNGIGVSFGFLFGPLLYLYSKSITQTRHGGTLKASDLIHISVFLVAFAIVVLDASIPFVYIYGALYLQTTPYMVACFVVIIHYRRQIKDYYSSIDRLNLTWMLYVVGAFFLMWMVDLLNFILADLRLTGIQVQSYMVFISLMINFTFAILIFYKALQHPELFTGFPEQQSRPKYEQSRLTNAEKKEYSQKLKQYFAEQKPFLNPDLTINDVANTMGISSKYLSQIINESLHKNFYDFINSHRIEEAKKMLKNKQDSEKTVLEILYDSGFNSKSAFNTAFKKHTGYTPTQYRKQAL